VHDGITFEKRGIPAAVICTDLFTATADAAAEAQGMAGYRYALVPHPLGRLREDELLERAHAVLPVVVEILTGKNA